MFSKYRAIVLLWPFLKVKAQAFFFNRNLTLLNKPIHRKSSSEQSYFISIANFYTVADSSWRAIIGTEKWESACSSRVVGLNNFFVESNQRSLNNDYLQIDAPLASLFGHADTNWPFCLPIVEQLRSITIDTLLSLNPCRPSFCH